MKNGGSVAGCLAALALAGVLSGCSGGSKAPPAATSTRLAATPTPAASNTPVAATPSAPSITPTAAGTVAPTPRGTLVIPAHPGAGILRRPTNGPIVGAAPAMPAQYRVTSPPEVKVETFVGGLEVPWSLAFAPDGRLFVAERPGRIRIIKDGKLDPTPWATLPVHTTAEGGLMGMVLSPSFASDHLVYVCYTTDGGTGPRGFQNRISRLREVDGRGTGEQILLDDMPAARVHDGCRLRFGPDGKLYATLGDTTRRALAQDLSSLAGKILRLNPDGSIPADNPFGARSPIYSYGHRNPQGLAFDPQTGQLFETEHGPSGEVGFGAYDEVNIIRAGGNYGWPLVVGAPGLPRYIDPLAAYPDHAVPPGGATFYTGKLIPQWTGNFFFTSLGARHLQRLVLDATHTHVVAIERLFEIDFSHGVYGRLRDIVQGPDGALYMSTSNRDGRGNPAPDDDRVLRISPAS